MYKHIFFLLLLTSFCAVSNAQTLEDIFTNVDTLFMPGAAPGGLSISDQNATPIVSGTPCNTPQLHYSVAAEYQNGKVIAIAHESLLSDGSIGNNDNLQFVVNAIKWLHPEKRVKLKPGWINNNNTSTLQNTLSSDGYTFSLINGDIDASAISDADILILGNDWNGSQAYLASEITILEDFVANGGAIFIAGLGWSWPQDLDLYPMNAVAKLFGFEYNTSVISDPYANVNGAPKLYTFYPENINTTSSPYCPSPFVGINLERGEDLRVLRLAVSTNGEFTQQNGGVSNVNTLLEDWLAEINDIYGREYCVRFELIPNNEQLIFTDPATDPWATLPPGSGGCTNAGLILSEQANVFTSIIGASNYDISHVIAGSPFGGGCAGGLNSGLSGGLDIPVTRHEMGHQFSQSHTINNNGNNNYEPENGGWSIQGGNRHGYAHATSYHQLADFLLNSIPTTGTKVPTGNTIPTVDAGPDVSIPYGTPFTLRGIASDPDLNDNLTYIWDNMNRGIAQRIPVMDDSQGALFMRLLPDTSSNRTFPRMSDVIANNNSNEQEQLPTQPRILDIRLTVNDNHKIMYDGEMINASGTNSDDIQITVADAGPFEVTSQNTSGISYTGGSQQEITWNVNGTDTPPINTIAVRITMSLDGGLTYPVTLANRTSNDGTTMVTMPNLATDNARIKIEAVDNIYFDLNTHDFSIEEEINTSIVEFNSSSFEILPNPAKAYFQINFSTEFNYKVQLYNSEGLLINEKVNENNFDTADLSNGIYLVVVTDLDTDKRIGKKISIIK